MPDDVKKNDEFCIKNEEIRSKDEELCMKNDEICIKNEGFCRYFRDSTRTITDLAQ